MGQSSWGRCRSDDYHGAMASQDSQDDPTFHVSLGDTGPRFAVAASRTVLQAAEAAGVMLASSCRVGTCRTCMRQLAEGCVRYQMEWPGLLAHEKAEGWFLPCAAYPASDLVVREPAD